MTDFSEAYLSRDGSRGRETSRELIYYTFNEPDGEQAQMDLLSAVPFLYDAGGGLLLPRRNARKEQVTESVFKHVLDYGMDESQTPYSDPDASSFNTTLTFNLVGGPQHITTSRNYKNFTATGAGGATHTANGCIDVKNAIGWDAKTGQVRGVEIFAPVLDFGCTTTFPNRVVTQAYIDDLFDLTGTVCNATFRNRERGSVLFKGARGSKRGAELWEISFEFCWSKNVVNETLAGITYSKLGWEYLDVLFGEGTGAINGQTVQVPKQINIHEVYEFGDYSKLRIGV